MKTHKVIIKGGKIHFVYDDCMRPLMGKGKADVRRASHVEPTPTSDGVKWTADLTPVGGPILGPFDERQTALDEEVKWLNSHRLGIA